MCVPSQVSGRSVAAARREWPTTGRANRSRSQTARFDSLWRAAIVASHEHVILAADPPVAAVNPEACRAGASAAPDRAGACRRCGSTPMNEPARRLIFATSSFPIWRAAARAPRKPKPWRALTSGLVVRGRWAGKGDETTICSGSKPLLHCLLHSKLEKPCIPTPTCIVPVAALPTWRVREN